MREIKFRGKRIDNLEWVFGDLIENQGRFFIYHSTSETTIKDNDNGYITIEAVEIDNSTVGQFTGLHDKNGTPIYEGDIIDFGLNAVVKYHPFLCSFILDCDNREPHLNDSYSELGFMEKTSKKFVVIGNIHDTPELLK